MGETPRLSKGLAGTLNGSSPPLMGGVQRDGSRHEYSNASAAAYLTLQSLVMRNRHTLSAGYTGESDIYALDDSGKEEKCYELHFVRDGSIRGYEIHDLNGRSLLKVSFHGDINNPFVRSFKAFFRSPVLKWDVRNVGLYTNIAAGTKIGMIQEVFPDNRVFIPDNDKIPGVPRLEMQAAASLGQHYYLAVTGVPEPVGEVRAGLIGRVAARSEVYTQILRNCNGEEAVLWLTMMIATDMKRQKQVQAKNRAFGAFL